MDTICQLGILVMAPLTIFLLTRPGRKARRVGSAVGLIGQPLWIYTTYINGQFGLFIVSLWYTYCYINGVMHNGNGKSTVGHAP